MNAQDCLRQLIDDHQKRLIDDVPQDRRSAIVALLRAQDHLPHSPTDEPVPDLITGHRLPNLGGNKALALCFQSFTDELDVAPTTPGGDLDAWADSFLVQCGKLTEAETVLAHCETGFMRIVDNGDETFNAWVATKRVPTSWRERADIDWWASSLANRHKSELDTLRSARQDVANNDAHYRQVGTTYLKLMAYQLGYPPDTMIGGCTIQTYLDVLAVLIGWAVQASEFGEPATPQSEHALVTSIAEELNADPFVIGEAVAAFTVDRENASYHAAVPGVAAAPLVLIAPDQIVGSVYGLTTEPLLFLTRELRRRDAQAYHNTAYLRETVFRDDLYALFGDKRFVTSTSRIELRRTVGDIRTDIDAAVFDRKTGTLGIFELKSQDPFARTTAELTRQRDNILYANRQVSGVLDWIKRHGGDEILNRIDSRTAKKFRVQKVFPFVLGRYLAHFNDGPAPDPRAAWATWSQILRLIDERPMQSNDANPVASLVTRLAHDPSPIDPPTDSSPREIALDGTRLTVFPSYGAFQASAADRSSVQLRA